MTTTAQHPPAKALLIAAVRLADHALSAGAAARVARRLRKRVAANGRIVARHGAAPGSLN
jgi:hypothetical protein